MDIASEHLVAQRKAVEGHNKRDQDLLAIGPMIARVAALRLRVGLRLAFKIGARDVVQQHLVLNRKQLSASPRQMRFERLLVQEQMIKRAIEAILVDLLIPELKQIAKRRAAVPILGNMQLARWRAEPRRHQHGRHLRPPDPLFANRKKLLA
jgi:hypothetical protein